MGDCHLVGLLGWGLLGACQAVVVAKTDLRDWCYPSFHLPAVVEKAGCQLGAGVALFSPGPQELAQGPWPLLWGAARLHCAS